MKYTLFKVVFFINVFFEKLYKKLFCEFRNIILYLQNDI